MSFDAVSAAEALAEFELAFLFNTERANRLVQNKARANTIGFDDVVDAVMKKTWYAPTPSGLEGVVHRQTQQQVLSWLLGVLQSADANFEVKTICGNRIGQLENKLEEMLKTENDATTKANYRLAIFRLNKFELVVLPKPVSIAPGAPIGCDVDL
jgi:hypothetical protein